MPQITCKSFISWFFFLKDVTATFSLRSLPTKQYRSRQLLEARSVNCNVPQRVQNKANFFHMAYNTPPDLGPLLLSRVVSQLLSPHLIYSGHTGLPLVPQRHQPVSQLRKAVFFQPNSLPSLLVCLDDSRLDIPSPGRSLLTSSSELKSMCPVYFSSEHSV